MAGRNGRNGQDARPSGAVPSYVDFEPGLGFAEWRCEVLSLLEAS